MLDVGELVDEHYQVGFERWRLGRCVLLIPSDLTQKDVKVAYRLLKHLRAVLVVWASVEG